LCANSSATVQSIKVHHTFHVSGKPSRMSMCFKMLLFSTHPLCTASSCAQKLLFEFYTPRWCLWSEFASMVCWNACQKSCQSGDVNRSNKVLGPDRFRPTARNGSMWPPPTTSPDSFSMRDALAGGDTLKTLRAASRSF
jgi:hypothetical protein